MSNEKTYPFFVLKDEVKMRIRKSFRLQALICDTFDIHPNTLRRWLNEDAIQLLNFNLLYILWSEGKEKKLTDLLTTKREQNGQENFSGDEPQAN